MRKIHIANEKKRDAEIGFELKSVKKKTRQVLISGEEKVNVRLLRSTKTTDIEHIAAKFDDANQLAEKIISEDPEIDIESFGMVIEKTKKIYLDSEAQVAYSIKLEEVVKNPDGTEKERKSLVKAEANVSSDFPVRWTGKLISKAKAVKMFAFSRKYQLKHTNGLTYDFLFDMAKKLHESKSLMLVGAGVKGMEPLIFSNGGLPYRAFLDGRVDGDKYMLILQLTNLELKEINK